MPYSNKQMLRDANGDLIPQYWDVVEQDFKPLTGQGGANDVRLTGSIKEEIVSDLFDDIPAGTRHFAYIDVPNGYNALTVMCRTLEGKIESIGIIPSVNSLGRSEEHTSELQSRGHLVCRLLLEKKKKNIDRTKTVKSTE